MPGLTSNGKKFAQWRALQCYVRLQDYSGVVNAASDLIAYYPDEATFYALRGTAYIKSMNYMAAITE